MVDETAVASPASSPKARIKAALEQLRHPANLGVADRLHAHQVLITEMAMALQELMPEVDPLPVVVEVPHA